MKESGFSDNWRWGCVSAGAGHIGDQDEERKQGQEDRYLAECAE